MECFWQIYVVGLTSDMTDLIISQTYACKVNLQHINLVYRSLHKAIWLLGGWSWLLYWIVCAVWLILLVWFHEISRKLILEYFCAIHLLVQSLNSPFFPPHIGAEPGRAKEESRITCMRMLRTNQSKITRSQPHCSRQCVAQCLSQLALGKKTFSLTLIVMKNIKM